MWRDLELFELYRWALAIVCTVYAAIRIGQTLAGWLRYFGSGRHTMVLGRYAGILLLRLQIRRFAWDLGQIGALLAVLGGVLYLHRLLGTPA
jgi:hypothetical protein